jgi:hypothetical protein
LYVELLGLPGVTNYMHLLGAGYLYHYLKKWGNLYRYQQQGWEMKNGKLAAFEQKNKEGERWWKIWTSTHFTNNSRNAVVSTYHCVGYQGCFTILYIGAVNN